MRPEWLTSSDLITVLRGSKFSTMSCALISTSSYTQTRRCVTGRQLVIHQYMIVSWVYPCKIPLVSGIDLWSPVREWPVRNPAVGKDVSYVVLQNHWNISPRFGEHTAMIWARSNTCPMYWYGYKSGAPKSKNSFGVFSRTEWLPANTESNSSLSINVVEHLPEYLSIAYVTPVEKYHIRRYLTVAMLSTSTSPHGYVWN